jgi:type IV secretory pathway VirB9-like protein
MKALFKTKIVTLLLSSVILTNIASAQDYVPGQNKNIQNPGLNPTQSDPIDDPLQIAKQQAQAPAPAQPRATGGVSGSAKLQNLGLEQKAWDTPEKSKSSRQIAPGVIRFTWHPQEVARINIREGMLTVIKFPEDETIAATPYTSDSGSFEVTVAPNKRSFIIRSLYAGIDGNVVAYGSSGNVYNFYLRSIPYNSSILPDTTVQVMVPGMSQATGETEVSSPAQAASYASYDDLIEPSAKKAERNFKNGSKEFATVNPMSPSNMANNIQIKVPGSEDAAIAPVRAWHDENFTYLDFGPRASSMNMWPVAALVVQGVESPVGTRVTGRNRSMMVIEAVGNITLRNGDLLVCLDTIMPNKDPRYSIPPSDKDPRPASVKNKKEEVIINAPPVVKSTETVSNNNFPPVPSQPEAKTKPKVNAKNGKHSKSALAESVSVPPAASNSVALGNQPVATPASTKEMPMAFDTTAPVPSPSSIAAKPSIKSEPVAVVTSQSASQAMTAPTKPIKTEKVKPVASKQAAAPAPVAAKAPDAKPTIKAKSSTSDFIYVNSDDDQMLTPEQREMVRATIHSIEGR